MPSIRWRSSKKKSMNSKTIATRVTEHTIRSIVITNNWSKKKRRSKTSARRYRRLQMKISPAASIKPKPFSCLRSSKRIPRLRQLLKTSSSRSDRKQMPRLRQRSSRSDRKHTLKEFKKRRDRSKPHLSMKTSWIWTTTKISGPTRKKKNKMKKRMGTKPKPLCKI